MLNSVFNVFIGMSYGHFEMICLYADVDQIKADPPKPFIAGAFVGAEKNFHHLIFKCNCHLKFNA